jgi:cyclohexanone monooxygenase
MSGNLSVGIIGAGPGGMALGILLAQAGFRDFTIFDREGDVGGTWLINTYPGLACDVKSHLYSYSFDLNSDWSRLWPAQPEILEYFQRCADKYGLRPHLRLRTEIVSARWEEDTHLWCLTTSTGERHHFNVVVSAVGLFTRPLFPELAEDEPFTGTLMHSSRWDHSVSLEGARVAVLGTGSTASQLVPELAKVADKVYSVQRSPTWILPKPDRPRKLTPDHPMGCKRLVFSSDYLSALTRSNVEVLNSPARCLRSRSLVTEDGTERDVDVVVCATGYAAADYLGELDVSGEGGATLREVWRDGAYAYFGMAVPGFPNFFMLYGPNTNVGSNSVIFMLEAQTRYIVRALKHMRRRGKAYVAVRPAALAEFVSKVDRWMVGTVWTTQCSNYFRAANGRVVTQWPRSARTFWGMTRRFRPADFNFQAQGEPAVDAAAALDKSSR